MADDGKAPSSGGGAPPAAGGAMAGPPAISLPTGGGAIRGMGERFAANPVTGTGSMSVPIATSAARSGFGPELVLRYDSAAGNGPYGFGWQLNLPAITRRTDRGVPRYGDDDVFLLSGAEDLVPVPGSVERDGYRVTRFRPRIEGMFARIERWTRIADGDTHWRSISKANVLTVYGLAADSRVADPDDPRRVFGWRICQSYDDKGNAIAYDYVAEDSSNVDLSMPAELHRVRGANRYLKRIRYGNRVPLLVDTAVAGFRPPHVPAPDLANAGWMFEVVFDYGEGHYSAAQEGTVDASLTATMDWPARRDAFSTYRPGFEVRTYRLCRNILMFHHFVDELGAADTLVRATRLGYDEKPVGSFLRQVTASGYVRLTSGSYLERSMPALEFDYSPSPLDGPGPYPDLVLRELEPDGRANLPSGVDDHAYRWVDLDGEGIAGVLTEQGGAWLYKPNLGDGRLGPVQPVRRIPALAGVAPGPARRTQLVDIGGDGNLDLVDFTAGGFYQRAETGEWDGFREFRSWPVLRWADGGVRFADVTGDGHADVLITEDEALVWHASLARDGFGPAVRVRVPRDEQLGPRVVFADTTQSVYLADLSGDGLTDIVRIRDGEVCYWPNLGYGR
ncbi:MAG TPA: SpvB/TcaC N-terminal domain-containing protein, partial [Micromonosporaceae bacterium]|nr:SpvB/TcaC N-terminal domain-containing protein [Micromonosporaceae bacterium]